MTPKEARTRIKAIDARIDAKPGPNELRRLKSERKQLSEALARHAAKVKARNDLDARMRDERRAIMGAY